MRKFIPVVLVLSGVALIVSMAVADRANPLSTPPKDRPFTPSPVLFPDQELPLRFFHDKHLAEEMECSDCHEAAEKSVRASDVLLPVGLEGEETCTMCHDLEEGSEADPPAACATCHTESYEPTFPKDTEPHASDQALTKPATAFIPPPRIKMNHKIHIDKGIACTTCHGDMKDIQVATRDNSLPVMGKCMECHDGKQASSECRTCHMTRPDGRLVTTFGPEVLKPSGHYRMDDHNDNYLKTHALTARGDEEYCSQCHEESYCLKCHNGVARPLKIHPNNWILIHPISARRDDPTCSSCHRAQSFCVGCHQRSGVANSDTFGANKAGLGYNKTKYGGFHPDGWVGAGTKNMAKGPNHHAFHAKRNIRACASCHVERTCANCHAPSTNTGLYSGAGISPHGPGFSNSRKCQALLRTNQRVCTKCHAKSDPLLNSCR